MTIVSSPVRVVLVTSETSGLPIRCITALTTLENVEVVCVILAREGLLAGRGRRLYSKVRKAFRIGILATLNGLRIRGWFKDPEGQSLASACMRLGIELRSFERA